MAIKNYYVILGIPQSATADEIKAAFRTLAKKYHPDKAPDNPFAAAHFTELQEAYEVLSNSSRRIAYDEDRWLRGLTTRSKTAVRITPEWILGEAIRLHRHIAAIDTYRMNHAALRDYIAALLSDEHLSMLYGTPEISGRIIDEILQSAKALDHRYTGDVATKLTLLAAADEALLAQVTQWTEGRRTEARWARYHPIIIVAFALLICVLIWWLK